VWGPSPDRQQPSHDGIRRAVRVCAVDTKTGEAGVADEWSRGHCDGAAAVYSDSNSNSNEFKFNLNHFKL
jgi:hypothetical protein